MYPTTNLKVVEIARALGLKSYKIIAGDPADMYVIPYEWGSGSDEAYCIGDVMCAVIERLAPLIGEMEEVADV